MRIPRIHPLEVRRILWKLILDTWIPEYFAVGVSVASLFATIVLLVVFDGRDTATWKLPDAININAVISAVNTISKSSILFALSSALGQWKWILAAREGLSLNTFAQLDEACRGPSGCAQVLWSSFRFVNKASERLKC